LLDLLSPEFISDIFSAALDSEAYLGLTNLIGRKVGAGTGGIWTTDGVTVSDMSFSDAGQESVAAYVAHYHKLDIWQANCQRMPREQMYVAFEHTDEKNLLSTEFYNDFARHYELLRPVGAIMQLRPGVTATFSFDRQSSTRPFAVEDKVPFQRLVPYIKSALQLRLRQRDKDARLYAAALDRLAFGAVICNARSEIVFANPAAEELAQQGAGVVLGRRGKGLSAIVPMESRALGILVHATANGGPGGVLRLSGANGATELLVLVTPLPRQLQSSGGTNYVLISLRSAREQPAFVEASIASLFGLSPAQAAIAIAVHAGKTPEEIAAERGVRISTVRSHLAQIFARTGAENQRDLVRLLSLLPPLR
jgi:DNA-binding CsgD family transcriptional regulator/PAS domain-containing protein